MATLHNFCVNKVHGDGEVMYLKRAEPYVKLVKTIAHSVRDHKVTEITAIFEPECAKISKKYSKIGWLDRKEFEQKPKI